MTGNNQSLFFSPEEKGRAFSDVLKEVQEYISSKYSTLMVEGGNEEVKQQVKRYIAKYVADYRITVKGKTREQLIDDLYTEMAEFSFLTKYIFGTGIEEIDINSWKDIEVQYSDGRCEKLEEHFESPEHAINVIVIVNKKVPKMSEKIPHFILSRESTDAGASPVPLQTS